VALASHWLVGASSTPVGLIDERDRPRAARKSEFSSELWMPWIVRKRPSRRTAMFALCHIIPVGFRFRLRPSMVGSRNETTGGRLINIYITSCRKYKFTFLFAL
jgi:hypothetical protein